MDIKKEQNLKNKIASIFKEDEKVFIDGEISWTHLIDFARKLDEEIINKLLQDNETKNHFFKNISGNYNFLFDKFERFINSELLDNSYTSFKNRIGLTADNRYIKDSKDIVLNFPFKDCYLAGGQTKDEGEEEYFYKDKSEIKSQKRKRKEIFFNEYIAYDEIDSLLSKKAFCNFKKYTKNGTEEVKSFNRNENGIIKDNLIIKGNNLLTLHSLYSEFKGKVKLIYIDPPYNTRKDTFNYNDNFNHSSWLVFMKDRLKIAKELLKEDGVIFVQCDDIEQAYLKVLMDEIFNRNNFIINCIVNKPSEIATANTIQQHEYILIYTKNNTSYNVNSLSKFTISRGTIGNKDQTMPIITFPKGLLCKNIKDGVYKETRKITDSLENVENLDNIVVKNGVLQNDVRMKARWRSSNDMRNFFNNKCQPTQAKINGVIVEIYFENDRFIPQIKKDTYQKIPSLFLENKKGSKDLEEIGLKDTFDYPKSEFLLQRILELSTNEGDLILDFFAGSGTTLSVAHKMKRQYIGIEQIERHFDICIERLKKVIEGEQGGISKKLDWTGGGEFISFESAQHNEIAKEKIIKSKNYEEIKNYFSEICDKFFLRYNLNIKEFEEKIIESEEFKNLDLEKQKEIFIKLLDPNQMYINYSNMEDKKYKLNEKDIKLTREFYKND